MNVRDALNVIIKLVETKDELTKTQSELKQLRWIPISEEMPLQVSGHWGSKLVLATDGKQAWMCKYNFSASYWTAPSGDITHWKPIILPEQSLKGE